MQRAGNAIGVTQWSLDGRGPETIERAAALGFETIHLSSGALDSDLRLDDDSVRDRYRRAADDCGVTIGAISGGDLNDLGLTSPAGSPEATRCELSIRIAIEAADDLHVPLVFLPSFRAGEIHDDAGLSRTAEVLAEACDFASGRPVTVATENTLSVDGNLRLLRATRRSDLRVLLDTQNPALWGHAVAPMVDGLWRYLVDQVHVKDGIDGVMGNAVLGEGDSGFAATMAALRRRGFAGALVSENDYHGGRSELARRDIAILAGVPTG
jgi:2-epi-5-epi-valiolone 7-phosphate 2-epimerase